MGLFIGLLLPLFTQAHNLLGSPLYYMRDPRRWFRQQAEQRVNWNFTTNSVMASTLASLRLLDPAHVDLSRFYLYFGAEKVAPTVWRRTCEAFERLGTPRDNIRIGYGLAENALAATSTKDGPVRCMHVRSEDETRLRVTEAGDPEAMELVSVGRPHVNTEIRIRDQAGEPVAELTLGEICVRGPCVTPGYFADPLKSAEQIVDGELRTRDLGFWFDGELYFVARTDDVLVVGGRNIAPDDVEDCVETLEGVPVGGAVLFDVPVVASGKTELVLLVELYKRLSADEAAERRAQLRDHVLAERGILIHHIAFAKRNALEKTSSGKKRRKLMRERFMKRELELS
jgi:fatty-acyl-CoA synthase